MLNELCKHSSVRLSILLGAPDAMGGRDFGGVKWVGLGSFMRGLKHTLHELIAFV